MRVAALAVMACVAVLMADYVVVSYRTPQDDKLIKALQQQVKSDAAVAPKLVAEQKRITVARQARKFRDNVVSWALIAAASLFLVYVKRPAHQPLAYTRSSVPPPAVPSRQCERPVNGTFTTPALDLSFVDRLIAEHGRSREAAIPILQGIQTHYRYLPDEALRRVCELTEITPAQIAGTSSFYHQFRRSPVGKHIVRVCHGTACHVSGARQISEELRRHLVIPEGADTDAAREFTLEEVACLGCCSLAPVLMVDGRTAGRLTPSTAPGALQEPV